MQFFLERYTQAETEVTQSIYTVMQYVSLVGTIAVVQSKVQTRSVNPWVYGPGLHFALYYSYGTNKADVLHYSVDGLSNFGFRLGVSF